MSAIVSVDRFRLLVGFAAWLGTPSDAASRCGMVVRPARRRERRPCCNAVRSSPADSTMRKGLRRTATPNPSTNAVVDVLDALVRKSLVTVER